MSTQKSPTKFPVALDVQFATGAMQREWEPLLPKRKLLKWIRSALKQSGLFTLRFVGEAEGKKLNIEFRGIHHATNILTFTYEDELGKNRIVADFVICMPIIKKEAKAQRKDPISHLAHMVIHGVLHAQGFDHEDSLEAEAMESLEISILQSLGIKNPYE